MLLSGDRRPTASARSKAVMLRYTWRARAGPEKYRAYSKMTVKPDRGGMLVLMSKPYTPGRGRRSTLTSWPLSPNVVGGKTIRANTMFSGGPCRIMMILGVPATKVTDVSDGGGPEVSRTMTRESGSTRTGGGVAVGALAAWREEPHAPSRSSPVAQHPGLRDIARREKRER